MHTNDSKAFTLIELLVVIAIIALLLAILMPSLGAAKKRGQDVVCLSNLKQIGMAANLYANDYAEKIPRGDGGGTMIWFMKFLPYVGQSSNITYYKQVDIYKCKSFPRSGFGFQIDNGSEKEVPNSLQTVCYVVNAWAFENSSDTIGFQTDEPTRLSKIRIPSSTAYLTDNEAGEWRPIIESELSSDIGRCDIFKPTHLPMSDNIKKLDGRRIARERHRNGCNLLFLDWHAERMDAEDITMKTLRSK